VIVISVEKYAELTGKKLDFKRNFVVDLGHPVLGAGTALSFEDEIRDGQGE